MRGLVSPDLLILNKAGMQHGTDEEKNILFALIDGRYELSRSTILTTNHAMSALEELIGERWLDRLREGSGRMAPFEWLCHRRTWRSETRMRCIECANVLPACQPCSRKGRLGHCAGAESSSPVTLR